MDEGLLRHEVFSIIEKYSFDKERWNHRKGTSRIIQDLGINSARIVDIIIDLEEKYDIEIDDEALESISTVDDVVRILRKKLF